MFDSISSQASKLIDMTQRSDNLQKSKTKLLTITSGKGGVGKSTFTANIAYLFASRGLKVAVIDADIGLANMQVLFDIKPHHTLHLLSGTLPFILYTHTPYTALSD